MEDNNQTAAAAPAAQTIVASAAQTAVASTAQTTSAPENVAATVEPVQEPVEDGFNEYKPGRKRRKTSFVWKHFTEVVIENEVRAQCHYCKQFFAGSSKGGTSHLKRHFEICPSRVNNDIKNYLVTDSHGVIGSLKSCKFDNDEVRRYIVLFVVRGNHPFTIVEQREFRIMMSRVNPLIKAFSRHTLKKELMLMYASEMVRVKELLVNAKGRVCLTTDNWRNEHTRQEYICITCHFVDNDWNMQKFIIRFRALAPPYDGINIVDELFMCLCQWNIDHKIFTITTDNASYNDSMLNFVKARLNARKSLLCGGDFFQVRCCAHIVNLIVQAGLEVIKGPLDTIRDMIKCIYRSSKRSKRFFDIAKDDFKLQVTRKFRLMGMSILGKVYGKDMSSYYVQKIVDKLHALFKEYEDPKVSSVGTSSRVNFSGNVDDPFFEYSTFMDEVSSSMEKSQVCIYLSDPTLNLNEELDILEFWNKSSMKYPQLARLACDILTIPITTVASEYAFSIGGKIITSTRNSLKLKTVQAVVCLRDWVKASGGCMSNDDGSESSSDESEAEDVESD